MTGSLEDFKNQAGFDGDGWGLYAATAATDFTIEPWHWLMEASPFANGDTNPTLRGWGQAWVSYNAWAASVGRAVATVVDLQKAGIGPLLNDVARLILAWPAWQQPGADFSTWSLKDLVEHLATLRAQATAVEVLQAAEGGSQNALRPEASQPTQMAIAQELERRGVRS